MRQTKETSGLVLVVEDNRNISEMIGEYLEGRGFERRAGNVRLGDKGRQPDEDPLSVVVPMRRKQSRERRHQIAAAVVGHPGGERTGW